MGSFACLIVIDILIPMIMIVSGCLLLYHPPRTINNIYGYRTRMSMKNQKTWDFAHKYCGKLWKWALGKQCIKKQ